MNTIQIQSFIEVAKTSSYTRAAENLFTSQPVITYQIKSLEKELEVQLFERNNRNVVLTAAGSYFFNQIMPLFQQIQGIKTSTKQIQNENHFTFTLLARRLADYEDLTEIISLFSKKYPDSHVEILSNNDTSTQELLWTNEIQLAYCYEFETHRDKGIEFLSLSEAHYYVFVSKDHPLSAYKSLNWDDLAGYKLILADTELHRNSQLISLDELQKRNIQVLSNYNSFDSMLLNVQAGVGFTILPCSKSKKFANLVKIPLISLPSMPLGLAWLSSRISTSTLAFIETARIYKKERR